MPHEFVIGAFEPGDDDMADFMLDRWLPFARDECNWVDNRAPVVGTLPDIELWTHRGTVGTPVSPFYFIRTEADHMMIFNGDDVDLTEEIFDQPNNPANAPTNDTFPIPAGNSNVGAGFRCQLVNNAVGPYQGYWLFCDTTGEYIHCVLKVSAREYRHFHIGRLRQIDGGVDLDPESYYCTGHFWSGVANGLVWPTAPVANQEHAPYQNHAIPFRNFGGTSVNGAFGVAMLNTVPGTYFYMPGLFPIQISAASVQDGGTGHAVDDIITVSLTDGIRAGVGTAATLRVTAETAGVIDTVSIETVGVYDEATGDGDTNPVADIDQASSSGSGVNAIFGLTFEGYKYFMPQGRSGIQPDGAPSQKSGDGGVTTSTGNVMLRSRIGAAQTNYYAAGLGAILWACDANFTANANVLVPIFVSAAFDFQSDVRQGVVAQVPDIFRVNMRDFSPEQTITVSGQDYKVFPVINDDAVNVLTDEGYSGFEGLAYRVETGPVV